MRPLVWLASYPKSGNTWMRALVASLAAGGRPVDINALSAVVGAADCHRFDDVFGVDSADLTDAELAGLRPRLYEALAAEASGPILIKVHDALVPTPCGELLAPASVTRAAIYVVRNPLDVAPSLAHHLGIPIDRAVAFMANPDPALGPPHDRGHRQMRQRLLDWSAHVESWLGAPFPVHVVRYEDLHRAPCRQLARVAAVLELPAPLGVLRRAVSAARFGRLQQQEQASGFMEAPAGRRFFRRGHAGSGRRELGSALVQRIVERHGPVMRRLGYIRA